MNKRNGRWVVKEAAAVAAASLAMLTASSAWGLGLGRLTVQSALGDPLRAEIDVTSLTPEEASALRVRVAPPESYRVAGIDYNSVLPATSVALQRRADGTAFLRVLSDRPVQEPFVDLILELSWSSGRLLREYTLLFDPPKNGATVAATTSPVVTAPVAPQSTSLLDPTPAPRPAVSDPLDGGLLSQARRGGRADSAPPTDGALSDRLEKATRPGRGARPAPAPRDASVDEDKGDLADKSAAKSDKNYRVRSGDTLSKIASQYQPQGISLDQMLVSLYRSNKQAFGAGNMNRLKAGVVLNVPSAEEAGGVGKGEARRVIQAQSADFNTYRHRLAGAVPKASEAEPTRKQSGKVEAEVQDRKQTTAPTNDRLTLDKGRPASAAAMEDKVAHDRSQKEADDRVKELSRNLEDLKKLQAASGSAGAGSGTGEKGGLPMGATPVPPKASEPEAIKPPVAVASAPSLPEAASAPAPVIMPEASAPAMPVVPPAQPDAAANGGEEGSFLSALTDNPLVLPGAGVPAVLLAGLGWYRLRGRNKEDAGVTSFLESRLQPDSFFGASGGQRIDTRDASGTPSSMSYSLSQIDAIGDVDPVAEADVYLAYGRDLQAEEILKEAMRTNPERLAIRTKLLEVYAKRRDVKGFEALAGELYGLTGGHGDDWAKVQELGRTIEAENPLYEPGGTPSANSSAAAMTPHEPLGASTMPQSVAPASSRFENSVSHDVSFDELSPDSLSPVDLDISLPAVDHGAPSEFSPSRPSGLSGFDTGTSNLKFELGDVPSKARAPSQRLDLGDISLDLDSSHSVSGDLSSSPLDLPLEDDDSDPLARKLELAEEFRQIGDLEGARDLLQEVVEKADGSLRSKAMNMLDNLA